jgi:hypothetical protein
MDEQHGGIRVHVLSVSIGGRYARFSISNRVVVEVLVGEGRDGGEHAILRVKLDRRNACDIQEVSM